MIEVSEELYIPMGGSVDNLPTSMIGALFHPGKKGDAEISRLLRRTDGVSWSTNKGRKEVEKELRSRNVMWQTYKTDDGFVAIILYAYERKACAAYTRVFAREGQALACALHHLLLLQA